ncbi:MAG: chemotaxis protein, partial [Rhodobacteraceae bacterium]|nr:chemotaxis protein [Paracoccaceae bacterium]
ETNTAVNQLDQVTQQNAAMFEQTTAASHALTRGAVALAETTARFRTRSPSSRSAALHAAAALPQARSRTLRVQASAGAATLSVAQGALPDDGWAEF